MRDFTLVSIFVLSFASTAHAQALTVEEMLPHCETALGEGRKHVMNGWCMGTIEGLGVIMTINCAEGGVKGNLPYSLSMQSFPSVTAGAQAFVNWARSNPTRWGERFSFGAAMALSETWPCEN